MTKFKDALEADGDSYLARNRSGIGTIADPVALGIALATTPGIVEHGIFPGSMVERVVIAGLDGVRELVNNQR